MTFAPIALGLLSRSVNSARDINHSEWADARRPPGDGHLEASAGREIRAVATERVAIVWLTNSIRGYKLTMITTAGTGLVVFGAIMAITGAILDVAVTTTTSGFNVNAAGIILLIAGVVIFLVGVTVLAVHLSTRTAPEGRVVRTTEFADRDRPSY